MYQRPRTTGSLRDVTDLFLTDQWRANRTWLTNGNLPARVGKETSSIKVEPYHYILHHVIIYIIIPYHCIIIILYHPIACMLYHVIIIIESVDSISKDERGFPLTQYITNGRISRGGYTFTHFKHHHRVLRLISYRMGV